MSIVIKDLNPCTITEKDVGCRTVRLFGCVVKTRQYKTSQGDTNTVIWITRPFPYPNPMAPTDTEMPMTMQVLIRNANNTVLGKEGTNVSIAPVTVHTTEPKFNSTGFPYSAVSSNRSTLVTCTEMKDDESGKGKKKGKNVYRTPVVHEAVTFRPVLSEIRGCTFDTCVNAGVKLEEAVRVSSSPEGNVHVHAKIYDKSGSGHVVFRNNGRNPDVDVDALLSAPRGTVLVLHDFFVNFDILDGTSEFSTIFTPWNLSKLSVGTKSAALDDRLKDAVFEERNKNMDRDEEEEDMRVLKEKTMPIRPFLEGATDKTVSVVNVVGLVSPFPFVAIQKQQQQQQQQQSVFDEPQYVYDVRVTIAECDAYAIVWSQKAAHVMFGMDATAFHALGEDAKHEAIEEILEREIIVKLWRKDGVVYVLSSILCPRPLTLPCHSDEEDDTMEQVRKKRKMRSSESAAYDTSVETPDLCEF